MLGDEGPTSDISQCEPPVEGAKCFPGINGILDAPSETGKDEEKGKP